MTPSRITKGQWLKIVKVALYAAASAAISWLVAEIANNPDLFGQLTPVVNILLVSIKQLFTKA